MTIDLKKLAEQAGKKTNEQMAEKMAALSALNNEEIETLINETQMNKEQIASWVDEIKSATNDNNAKAVAIENIAKGSKVVFGLLSKLIA